LAIQKLNLFAIFLDKKNWRITAQDKISFSTPKITPSLPEEKFETSLLFMPPPFFSPNNIGV